MMQKRMTNKLWLMKLLLAFIALNVLMRGQCRQYIDIVSFANFTMIPLDRCENFSSYSSDTVFSVTVQISVSEISVSFISDGLGASWVGTFRFLTKSLISVTSVVSFDGSSSFPLHEAKAIDNMVKIISWYFLSSYSIWVVNG